MKTITLSFISLLATVTASAQSAQQPFKGANVILIQLPDSGAVAWQKAAGSLVRAGYVIRNADKDLLTISTEPKPDKRGLQSSVSASVSGRTLRLAGTYVLRGLGSDAAPIIYRGMAGSPTMLAWEQLDKAARQLGGVVTYTIQ